jgi:teichuronic acid biosynthesis glycosyltransferase TuaH
MNKDYDIIFFTLFRTDNPYSSISLSMAKELAKNHRVFYVNHPYSTKDIIGDLKKGDKSLKERLFHLLTGQTRYESVDTIPHNFVAAQPPMTLPINWLPKGKMYDFFQRINNGIILRTIEKIKKDHNVKNFVYLNCFDPFYAGYLPKKMGAMLSIYHCIDDITQNAYSDKHGTDLENEAIRQSDLTFVTSTNLKTLKDAYSDRIEYYFNAVDNTVFEKVLTEKYPKPKELEGRTGKVIGFVGNLDELRIDYPLLKKVALAHPEKTLLLIGPINSTEPKEIGLDLLPNVIFAGSRKLQDLPPLVQYMDVVMIPFLCNTLTKSIYPLKINEYLSAGKPVISTTFSDDIRTFSNVIYLGEDHPSFIQNIDEALEENNQTLITERTKVANTNTWEARIGQLWEIVDKYTGQRNTVSSKNGIS